MKKFALFVVLLTVAGFVVYYFSGNDIPEESKKEQQPVTEKQPAPVQKSEESHVSAPSQKAIEGVKIISSHTEESSTKESDTENEQEEQSNAASIRQWAFELREFALSISKLYAVRDGRFFLEDGEEEPDLHAMFDHTEIIYKDLPLADASQQVQSAVETAHSAAATIVQTLSRPPTTEELQNADAERPALQEKIDAIYPLIQ